MKLNKKQVKAIVKLITSEPCKTRPALQTMRIKRDGYAYITNGYMAVRFKLETSPIPKDDTQEEFIIPAENLEKWYKIAKSKDYLDEISILALQDIENTTIYPDISKLIKNKLYSDINNDPIRINEQYLRLFTEIAGDTCIKIFHYDLCIAVITLLDHNIDAILMEITK